jgi:hypothetical protein
MGRGRAVGEEFWKLRGVVVTRYAGRWTHLVRDCCLVGIGKKRCWRTSFVALGAVETVAGMLEEYIVACWVSTVATLQAVQW